MLHWAVIINGQNHPVDLKCNMAYSPEQVSATNPVPTQYHPYEEVSTEDEPKS